MSWDTSAVSLLPSEWQSLYYTLPIYVGNSAWRMAPIVSNLCRHPHVRDVCDIGRILFGGSKIAYELTMVGLILNNVFIQALHIVVGEKVLNTLSNHAICTIAFGAILTVIYFICISLRVVADTYLVSLPRTLAGLSTLSVFSAGIALQY